MKPNAPEPSVSSIPKRLRSEMLKLSRQLLDLAEPKPQTIENGQYFFARKCPRTRSVLIVTPDNGVWRLTTREAETLRNSILSAIWDVRDEEKNERKVSRNRPAAHSTSLPRKSLEQARRLPGAAGEKQKTLGAAQ